MKRQSGSRQDLHDVYRVVATIYLALHRKCEACGHFPSSQIHHTAGREGVWLIVVELFMAVCWTCHNWIHDHPQYAIDRGWKILRATRNRTMKTPSEDYNPFEVIARRLLELPENRMRLTCSRFFADKLIRTVIAKGGSIRWRDNNVMHIHDDRGTWPAIFIKNDLDGDAFILEQTKQ